MECELKLASKFCKNCGSSYINGKWKVIDIKTPFGIAEGVFSYVCSGCNHHLEISEDGIKVVSGIIYQR